MSPDSLSHHLVLCSIIVRHIGQFQGLMGDILVYNLQNITYRMTAEKSLFRIGHL
jgi:hypothetical protein